MLFFYLKPKGGQTHANQSRNVRADGGEGGGPAHRQLAGMGGLSHHRCPTLQVSIPRAADEGVQVFTIKAELHEVGLTTAQTPFGHDVPVYDKPIKI